MNVAQNQSYDTTLAFLGHATEQEQADPDSASCWNPHQRWVKCTGLLGEILATDTSRNHYNKLNSCLKTSNTHHLDICAVWAFRKSNGTCLIFTPL